MIGKTSTGLSYQPYERALCAARVQSSHVLEVLFGLYVPLLTLAIRN
ncbi:MAG: hypothetical protein QM736_28920 [Vicinamibacterales bacterium]